MIIFLRRKETKGEKKKKKTVERAINHSEKWSANILLLQFIH